MGNIMPMEYQIDALPTPHFANFVGNFVMYYNVSSCVVRNIGGDSINIYSTIVVLSTISITKIYPCNGTNVTQQSDQINGYCTTRNE
jgi:hypothetical protein